MILLQEALQKMEELDENGNLIPFSIEVVTADRARRTGGELLEIKNAVLTRTDRSEKTSLPSSNKPSNHYKNSTRNIKVVGTDQIRSIHIRLITKFNNNQVVY